MQFIEEVVLRTPLRPLKASFSEEEIIHIIKNDQEIYEALYLASPSLIEQINRIDELTASKKKKLIPSILKYLLRLHSRCTPFGLFANTGVVKWSGNNSITVPDDYTRKISYHWSFEQSLINKFLKNRENYRQFEYSLNSTIYNVGEKYRYFETEYEDQGDRKLKICEIETEEAIVFLSKIIERNNKSYQDINNYILDGSDVSLTESENFVAQLIDEQILVPKAAPGICGPYPLNKFSELSNKEGADTPDIALSKFLTEKLNCLESSDIRNGISGYKTLIDELKKEAIPYNKNKLFFVNSFRNYEDQGLSDSIKFKLKKTIKFIGALGISYKNERRKNERLERFKDAFRARYEDQWVPLLEVLDPHYGFGYPINNSNGEDDFISHFRVRKDEDTKETMVWTRLDQLKFMKVLEAAKSNSFEVEFKDSDLKDEKINYEEIEDQLPPSFSALFSILDDKTIYFKSAGNPSGLNVIGRYSTQDSQIKKVTEKIIQHEDAILKDHQVFAEVIHIDKDSTSNIAHRNTSRQYEIPLMSSSNAEGDHKILINDLFVKLSGNQIVLYSKKLKKQVIPRASTAYNHLLSDNPVFVFLCDLQSENIKPEVTFDWGGISNKCDFLPRATYNGVIISPASWKVKRNTFNEMHGDYKKILAWKEKKNIPDQIIVVEGDNELLIDFTSELSTSLFVDHVSKRLSTTIIKEFLFNLNTSSVTSNSGEVFTNEFIATILNDKASLGHPIHFEENTQVIRSFGIDDEWLYYKIYVGVKKVDFVLENVVLPFITQLKSANLIDQFFFIRYFDPDYHIRLRVRVKDVKNNGQINILFNQYFNPLLQEKVIVKVTKDTYNREIERYGECNISHCENLFSEDSIAVISFLKSMDQKEKNEKKWIYAIESIHTFLNDFGFDLEDKIVITETLRHNFALEFNPDKISRDRINKLYREKADQVLSIINDKEKNFSPILNFRSQRIKGDIKAIQENGINGNIIPSLIHMIMNRVFIADQRKYELVIYDFLNRAYRTRKAIERN